VAERCNYTKFNQTEQRGALNINESAKGQAIEPGNFTKGISARFSEGIIGRTGASG